MNLKKAFKVIFVDFLALIIGIINGFLLPKFLSVESYASIKMFALYISYSGMFHIGFSDGMYILLGGKCIDEIKKEKIKGYLIALIKILSIVSLIFIIIATFIIKDIIFKFFILYTIPFQITLFVSLLYRATGEFDKYTVVRVLINICNLLSVICVVVISKSPFIYMSIQVLGYMVIAFIYLIKIFSIKEKIEKIKIQEIKCLITTGFIVMIANTVNNLFFSLDRWFVKCNFSINDFAFYSFGVSMLNLFLTLINSITILFYPYLAKNKGDNKIVNSMKKYIIMITSFAPAGYFILELIIGKFINEYTMSLNILGILILCIPFITLINVLYANLYKGLNKGNLYLSTAIKMLSLALVLNIIVLYLFRDSVSIAYATLISLIVWYFYSSKHFNGLNIEKKEIIHFSIYILSYIFIKKVDINILIKGLLFVLIISIDILLLYRNDVLKLKFLIKSQIKNNT